MITFLNSRVLKINDTGFLCKKIEILDRLDQVECMLNGIVGSLNGIQDSLNEIWYLVLNRKSLCTVPLILKSLGSIDIFRKDAPCVLVRSNIGIGRDIRNLIEWELWLIEDALDKVVFNAEYEDKI